MSVKQNLDAWRSQLMHSIPVGGLMSRNPTVYKWKAPFRAWMLREAVAWRTIDLLTQSLELNDLKHGLGARILLRSAFETVAIQIYLNQMMRKLLDGSMTFEEFGTSTSKLLLGSKNKSTDLEPINIMTVLGKADRRYPGMLELYGNLSESAHPSYAGFVAGYSKIDHSEYETSFYDRWHERYGEQHLGAMELCMRTFHHEYEAWPDLMTKLEGWIEANDEQLEAEKDKP